MSFADDIKRGIAKVQAETGVPPSICKVTRKNYDKACREMGVDELNSCPVKFEIID